MPAGSAVDKLGQEYLDRDQRASETWIVKHMKEMEDAGK